MNTETKEETAECNKLIAEFMGGKVQPNGTVKDYHKINIPQDAFYRNNYDVVKIGGYEYKTSWDWLMPVVEKIDSLDFKTLIGIEFCEITRLNESSKKVELIVFEAKESKKESVFQAVVEFIKWYNGQPDFLTLKQ